MVGYPVPWKLTQGTLMINHLILDLGQSGQLCLQILIIFYYPSVSGVDKRSGVITVARVYQLNVSH